MEQRFEGNAALGHARQHNGNVYNYHSHYTVTKTPFDAFGAAAMITQFTYLGAKVGHRAIDLFARKRREYTERSKAKDQLDQWINEFSQKHEEVLGAFQKPSPETDLAALQPVALKCHETAQELLEWIDKIRARVDRKERTFWQAVAASITQVEIDPERDEIEARLHHLSRWREECHQNLLELMR